jgi:DNA-binding protein YbaB
MQAFIGELQQSVKGISETRQKVAAVTGVAWSDDRTVKAVVGPRGQLVDLDIDPRVFRNPNSKALSATIVATVRAAVEDANRKTREIMEKAMPKDPGLGIVGRTDFDRWLGSHDADLPRLTTEEEDGRGYVR